MDQRVADITVVIPALDGAPFLPKLLEVIERQTLTPREVVIVDSSAGDETAAVISRWMGRIAVIHHRVDFAFPGHARNIGVAQASGEWIAFIDCRTIPCDSWLAECAVTASREGVDFVAALLTCSADTFFKGCLLAATYGRRAVRSLPGSLVRKAAFVTTSGFLADVRAGEDVEWMSRLAGHGIRTATVDKPVLLYDGLPDTLGAAVRKWHRNNLSAAPIDVNKTQKMIYTTLLVILLFLLAFRWNALFANWREDSAFYIPNITKMFITALLLLYVLYRGLVRPLLNRVPYSFLLPCRWIVVAFVALCLDVAKAPGMLLGACILIGKRLSCLSLARLF